MGKNLMTTIIMMIIIIRMIIITIMVIIIIMIIMIIIIIIMIITMIIGHFHGKQALLGQIEKSIWISNTTVTG